MSDIGSAHSRLRCDFASKLGHLEEIVTNIVARLPVKNVVACKCVDKCWKRLISEPQFPALQLSLSEKEPKYIICPYPEDHDIFTHLYLLDGNGHMSRRIELPAFANICSPQMVCFLNGLMCSVDEDQDEVDVNIRIFNPTTQDFLLLPRGTPSHVTPSVGLAFDPETYDYKAFRFFSDSPEDKVGTKYKCEVYTSSSGEWKVISEGVQPPKHNPYSLYSPNYVSVAEKMYWFAWSAEEPGEVVQILSVDMNDDKFTEIELPIIMDQWCFLIELEGCLSVVHLKYPRYYHPYLHPKPYVEVYKLLTDGEWCLRAEAELDVTDICCIYSVAARDKELFFIISIDHIEHCYLIFDLNDATSRRLDLEDYFEGYSPVAFPFVESLLKCS